MLTQISYFVQNKSLNIIYLLIFLQTKFGKSFFIHTCAQKGTQSHQNLTFAQSVAKNFNFNISNVWCQIVLVPNCPVPNCPGAKLSWCQIVLVPNCPLLISWCQIVLFYYLGAKLSALLSWCQIVRCQIVEKVDTKERLLRDL